MTNTSNFLPLMCVLLHFLPWPPSKRLKRLKIEPYTQAEAERAAGMGSYVAPKKVNIPTDLISGSMDDGDDAVMTGWTQVQI